MKIVENLKKAILEKEEEILKVEAKRDQISRILEQQHVLISNMQNQETKNIMNPGNLEQRLSTGSGGEVLRKDQKQGKQSLGAL